MAKKALVVGISGYSFPNDLPSGARDAEAFATMLETVYRFDQVRTLRDSEAARDGVERGLDWLFQDAGPNDRLVFFFSGHGCRYEKSGGIAEALVLQDGRLLADHQILERVERLPAGVFTAVLDCCFSGFDELLIHPSGEVEIARVKRWLPTESDRGRSERLVTPGAKAFTPFGHTKPAALDVLTANLRGSVSRDATPARLVPLAEPQAKGIFVMASLGDETTVASTTQTGTLSPFTQSLINEIRRRGPNRSTFELLHATGEALRRLGLRQTPRVIEPLQPEHLGLRAFLTFQPVLSVYPSQAPGREGDDDLSRSIAEAVRSALTNIQEGRSMHATIPGQSFLGDEIGMIVNTVTPIVASMLQSRGGYGSQQSWMPQMQMQPHGWPQGYQPPFQQFQPPLQQFQQPFQQFQQPFQQFQQPYGGSLPPYEIAQIVSTVTPIVLSLLQQRSYQGHFGQFMPRAA